MRYRDDRSICSYKGKRERDSRNTVKNVHCVKFQTKRRARLPKRGNSSYSSQHGSSATGTAAQAPQLGHKKETQLGFGIVIVIENIVNGIFGSAELGGCFCPQPNLVQLQ